MPPDAILANLRHGVVIPAHPLALNADGKFDERRMRGLTRYYIDAGAGGLAVGVHTTQFEIRDPVIGLYKPVLKNVRNTEKEWNEAERPIALIAGICGDTSQAVSEAQTAVDAGYHAGLLSLGAMKDASDDELIAHCKAVSEIIPLFGFYLQTAVGGRRLGFEFWARFAEIENVVAIKIAPFSRYETLEVARAVAASGRNDEIALYTGNDDNILFDLLTEFDFGNGLKTRIAGGLLGQWAVWTRNAVAMLDEVKRLRESRSAVSPELLRTGMQLTDANAAIFDARNNFARCIPGIHEVLRRQGLLENRRCIDPGLDLSPSQMEEIDRIWNAYPELRDDGFVNENRERWLKK